MGVRSATIISASCRCADRASCCARQGGRAAPREVLLTHVSLHPRADRRGPEARVKHREVQHAPRRFRCLGAAQDSASSAAGFHPPGSCRGRPHSLLCMRRDAVYCRRVRLRQIDPRPHDHAVTDPIRRHRLVTMTAATSVDSLRQARRGLRSYSRTLLQPRPRQKSAIRGARPMAYGPRGRGDCAGEQHSARLADGLGDALSHESPRQRQRSYARARHAATVLIGLGRVCTRRSSRLRCALLAELRREMLLAMSHRNLRIAAEIADRSSSANADVEETDPPCSPTARSLSARPAVCDPLAPFFDQPGFARLREEIA